VINGKQAILKGADTADTNLLLGTWNTIRIVGKDNQIKCHLDGALILKFKDDTFKDNGKMGLWTQADAQTYFVDLKVDGK
jgi:hypothetical protein